MSPVSEDLNGTVYVIHTFGSDDYMGEGHKAECQAIIDDYHRAHGVIETDIEVARETGKGVIHVQQ